MGTRVLQAKGSCGTELRGGIEAIQREQDLDPEFPAAVAQAAERAVTRPAARDLERRDLTDLEFLTIDPAGAMDLDQAMHLATDGTGFVVHYAIADVMAFVEPGDPVDEESHRRGESMYAPDHKIPLHPKALSEAAGSLLAGEDRPAFVWRLRLDADGALVESGVERAVVRSRQKLDYEDVQREMTRSPSGSTLSLLRTVGELRIAQEAARGGVSLPMPAQEVEVEDGRWRLEYRDMLPVEQWNAQLSLLTGFAAASIMVEGNVGILRTLPPAPDGAVRRLRRTARALGIDWPGGQPHPDFIRALDPSRPADAAMVVASTSLLRGAGYAAFDGRPPEQAEHAALASSYAHVTAPLRRLVDRYGLEVCAALCAGQEVPAWVRKRLHELPEIMRDSGRRANSYENAVLNLVEAETLKGRLGERFEAVVTEADTDDQRKGEVMLREPAVEAVVVSDNPLPVGEDVTVTLTEADPQRRVVRFRL